MLSCDYYIVIYIIESALNEPKFYDNILHPNSHEFYDRGAVLKVEDYIHYKIISSISSGLLFDDHFSIFRGVKYSVERILCQKMVLRRNSINLTHKMGSKYYLMLKLDLRHYIPVETSSLSANIILMPKLWVI